MGGAAGSLGEPHEREDHGRVGLLDRERAVAIAVEAFVDGLDRLDPRSLERPISARDPQPEEDGPVLGQENQVVHSVTRGDGRRRVL